MRDQQSMLAISNHFRDATDGGGDKGHPSRQSFEKHIRGTFRAGRNYDNIRKGIKRSDMVLLSGQYNFVG
jgi:hypothetical protein